MSITLHEVVPDFTASTASDTSSEALMITGDTPFRLSDFRGQQVVIYFYPKDSTPGCTNEGIAFAYYHDQFATINTVIVGVSRDTLKRHENFKAKHEFPFELISDPEEQLCQAFGVIKTKKLYGKSFLGIERSTFLIDKEGKLAREWRKVKVKGHAEEVLEAARALAEK